jgi:hypothetical protein
MSEAVQLASTLPLPHAVAADVGERHMTPQPMRVLRSERLHDGGKLAVAPYQAVPVHGAITHHHATGLTVPMEDNRTEEVRTYTSWVRDERWRGKGENRGRQNHHCLTDFLAHVCWPPKLLSFPQERINSIHEIIKKYEKKLQERTRHHMGCVFVFWGKRAVLRAQRVLLLLPRAASMRFRVLRPCAMRQSHLLLPCSSLSPTIII